jgi:pyruvate dehydrogenase E2 component (dihydrolipoamide acetyltransferase)
VVATPDQRIRISPRAKRFAEKENVDYRLVSGSGPNGRIVCSDIQNALSGHTPVTAAETTGGNITAANDTAPVSAPTAATIPAEEFSEQPLSNVRKLIAKAMHSSLRDSAQLTHHMSADVRNVLEARRKIKEGLKNGTERYDITINDIVSYCVIKAIARHPAVNAHFLGESIRLFNRVHLGIAVDTPRGLMVPAVKNADLMDLQELSVALKASAEACRKGNINPELIQSTSASFTISNLGNYGVELFTPVINLPQCAILGVCSIINRPADLGNNIFGFVPYMGLSLTYDHRAVDGGPATLFLREIKEQIEQFSY